MKKLLYNSTVLTLLITTAGFLPLLIITGFIVPGGDSMVQMYPFIVETKRMLSSGDLPLWSWNTLYGDNFIAQYSYYTVTNPFAWLACLFPYEHLDIGIALSLYLKMLICAWLSEYYFGTHGFNRFWSLIGSLLLTFSSWTIANLYYGFFMEPLITFLILLIFIDRALQCKRHKWSGLILGTFIVAWVNYYLMPGTLIAAAAYYLCFLAKTSGTAKAKAIHCLKSMGCVFLGIGMAMAIILPTLCHLVGSERTGFSIGLVYTNIIWRILTLFLPSIHEGIRPFYIILHASYYSNQANIAVFGVLPALLYIWHNRRSPVAWFTLICIVAYITPLNGIFTLYSRSIYTRWAYALTFAIVLATLTYLKDNPVRSRKPMYVYVVACLGIVVLLSAATAVWLAMSSASESVKETATRIRYMSVQAIVLTANLACLAWLWRGDSTSPLWQRKAVWCIAGCAVLQILALNFSHEPWYRRTTDGFAQECLKSGYINYCNGADGYRTDLMSTDFGATANSSLIFNSPSVHTFSSTRNSAVRRFIEDCSQETEYDNLFITYTDTAAINTLFSVRTLIDFDSIVGKHCYTDGGAVPAGTHGAFDIYLCPDAPPIGFAYDNYVLADEIDSLAGTSAKNHIPRILLGAMAIEHDDEAELSGYLSRASVDSVPSVSAAAASRRCISSATFKGDSRGFTSTIDADTARVVFYSVPADAGFTATIDGNPTKIYRANLGFSAIIVPPGNHLIRFDYFPVMLREGIAISIACMIISLLIFFYKPKRDNE